MSSGVSIYVFNWMLLLLAGNYAVAAYGVVANVAIITLAAANGVALGVQPIAANLASTRRKMPLQRFGMA